MSAQDSAGGIAAVLASAEPRLLTVCSRLVTFSRDELARHAGVSHELAGEFISANAALFAQGDAIPGTGDSVWRLRAEFRNRVAARVAALVRSQPLVLREKAIPMSTVPKALELLEQTLDVLTGSDVLDADERRREYKLATIYLKAAEANVRDREHLSRPVDARVRQRIEHARSGLTGLGTVSQHESGWFRHEVAFLIDWTAQVQPASTPDTAGTFGLDDLLGSMFVSQRMPAAGLVEPARVLQRSAGQLTARQREELAVAIRARLAGAVPDRHGMLGALAALSAVLEDNASTHPLFRATLQKRPEDFSAEEHDIILLALARLARPRTRLVQGSHTAAAACVYMLDAPDLQAADVAIVAPAALCSPLANPVTILHKATEALFDADRMKRACADRLRESAIMCNFALALYADNFHALSRCIARLLTTPQGRAFIRSLCDPLNRALAITEANGPDFVVRPREQVFNYSHLPQIKPFKLNIRRRSDSGDALASILDEHRRAEIIIRQENRRAELMPVEPLPHTTRALSFSEKLQRQRRAERQGAGATSG